MKCPACTQQLTEVNAGDIKVDLCQNGCGGVWFDEREIRKFDEPHEFHAKVILDAPVDSNVKVDHVHVRSCPKCDGEVLCRRFYDADGEVEVDQCLFCSGIWLDVGELEAIRSQFKTEEERQKAADAWLAPKLEQALDQFEIAAARRTSEERKRANDRFTSFRAAFADFFTSF